MKLCYFIPFLSLFLTLPSYAGAILGLEAADIVPKISDDKYTEAYRTAINALAIETDIWPRLEKTYSDGRTYLESEAIDIANEYIGEDITNVTVFAAYVIYKKKVVVRLPTNFILLNGTHSFTVNFDKSSQLNLSWPFPDGVK